MSLKRNLCVRLIPILGIFILSGCGSIHVSANSKNSYRDYDSVFGGVTVDRGAEVRDVSSVNGGIEIKSNAKARAVDTVNGGIDIGNNVTLASAETVNGGIEIGQSFVSSGSVETVNGDVEIAEGGQVGKNIETVNGDILLTQVSVDKNIKTVNGDISLKQHSIVKGDLIIEKPSGWFSNNLSDPPEIEIDAESKVLGTIHLYRKVTLKIDEKAEVGNIKYYYTRK